jgi:myosin heavy subunit
VGCSYSISIEKMQDHDKLFCFSYLTIVCISQIGKTKVFLRAGQMAELDARRTEVLSVAAKIIQGKMRTHIMRKKFVSLRKASVCFQAVWRGLFACT